MANTITPKNNINTAQELKKLNLNCYKVHNYLTVRIVINSIYYNYQPLINSLIMIAVPQKDENIKPHRSEFVTLLGVKLNNKIYSANQLNSNIKFNYNEDYLSIIKTLKISLKPTKIFNTN